MIQPVFDQIAFSKHVEDAGEKLVVVDFHATWCGPCKVIEPYVEEMAREFRDVCFLKVDVDMAEETATKYDVTGIPKFVLLKNNVQVGEMLGIDHEKLRNLIVANK